MMRPLEDEGWRTLVRFPTKYIFSYYFELWEGIDLVNAYDDYLDECEEAWDEPEYDNYIEYTTYEGEPYSWLPVHYHGSRDDMVSNYIDSDNVWAYDTDEELPVFDDEMSYFNPWEIESIDEIVDDMIGGESLSGYRLSTDDLWKYAIFIADWHHRTLSAIKTMEKHPELDYVYVYTKNEDLISLYWVK